MSLLDERNSCYVFHERARGSGRILDRHNTRLGLLRTKTLPMKAMIELYDSDESLLCTIIKTSLDPIQRFDIILPDGKLIGRAISSPLPFKVAIEMYIPTEEKIYSTKYTRKEKRIQVIDPQDKKKIFAEIQKTELSRNDADDVFILKNKYTIQIGDIESNRLLLLAYAIIIGKEYQFVK